ncbi:MAG: hypothetical protein V4850_14380 [Myxococcota bacterium]
MKNVEQIIAAADECFERGEYSSAEQLYDDAIEREPMPTEGLVLSWITARSVASVLRARALVSQRPDSFALQHLQLRVLLREHEYAAAADAATMAISRFGSDPGQSAELRHKRLQAHVELSRHRVRRPEPSWDLIHQDVRYLWSAYEHAEKKRGLYAAIVEQLLGLRGSGASEILDAIADDLQKTHPEFACVLRSHATTVRLYALQSALDFRK